MAQNIEADRLLLLASEGNAATHTHHSGPSNSKDLMHTKRQHKIVRYNPITLLLKGAMYTYQNLVSPQLGNRCLYELSCSNFSKASIKEHGLVKGLFLSADRILRCNRISTLDFVSYKINTRTGKYRDLPAFYHLRTPPHYELP